MSNAGWTIISDSISKELGAIPAIVFGVILRHQKMTGGVCKASHETLAEKAGLNRRTIMRQIDTLIALGYVTRTGIQGATIEHKITDAALKFAAGESEEKPKPVTQSHKSKSEKNIELVTESHNTCDRKSQELVTESHIKSIRSIKSINQQTASAVCSAPESLQSEQGAQGAQENSTQSENCNHRQTHSLIGNETANLEPQSKNYNPDLDCQIPAPAAPPLPEAKPTKKPRKPRELSEKERAIVRLNAAFADARGVQPPSFSSPKAAKSAQVNWNAAHSELLANAGGDVDFAERVIRRVVGEYTASADSLNNRYPMIEPRSFRARYIQEVAAEKQRARAAMKAQQQQQPTAQQEDERIPVTRLAIPAFALK